MAPFYVRLLFAAVTGPAAVLVCYLAWACLACCRREAFSGARAFASALVVLLYLHPSLSATVLQAFRCQALGQGGPSYLT